MNSRGLVCDSILITILCADLMVQHALLCHGAWFAFWGISAFAWAVISVLRITS